MVDTEKIELENLSQAPDMEVIEGKRIEPLPTDLSQAPDVEALTEEIRARIPTDISPSSDKEVVQEKLDVKIPLEFAEAPNVELKSVFVPFDGQWMPDNEPIEIGAQNYKTLQNYRYAGDTIIHVESVLGYSKINTTSLSTYSYENIRNGYQLRSEFTKKTYVLVHTEHDTHASNYSKVYQNQTAIPSQGNFTATALHTDSAYSLEGRFSDAPDSQVAYCNGKESCIWAGEEMRCAGFFTISVAYYSAENDIAFSKTASPDTIVTTAGNFRDSGFKAGYQIVVADSASNDGEYVIVSISADGKTLTLGEDVLHADEAKTGGVTPIITVSEKRDYDNPVDYTEALNNQINSAAEAATVIGVATTATCRWLVLSTRPLQGVKYYLRTVNGTGSATTTCKVWDGDSFAAVDTPSDGTADSGSMKQSGTFSWNYAGTSAAKPLHFEGLYLYAYLFELSAGSAVIYAVTVNAPFQAIVDVWDGVYRQPIQFQVQRGYDPSSGTAITSAGTITTVFMVGQPDYYIAQLSSAADYAAIEVGAEIIANAVTRTVNQKLGGTGSTWWIKVSDITNWASTYSFTYANPAGSATADNKDFTLEVIEPSFADYPIGAVIDGLTDGQRIYIGFEERMSAIWFEMIADLVNTNSAEMSIGYWDGTQYVTPNALCDTTKVLVGKSFNATGVLSWMPPAAESEFRQTLFGVNAYYYEISVNATLSGTEGGTAEVVIDTVKGIPAQNVVNPFKFSVQYKNRLMLCGFTEGKEGNRIDFSVKDAPDVFNGEESSMDGVQSLYIGGREDLTGAIEIFNRFGSNIISSLLLFKNTETYLLTGDGPENYRIYTISKTIGCPAPLTLAAAETGYTFAEEINRNIVAWVSYSGPMIFDGAAILPIPGIRKYFDPAKTARLQTSVIERCRGWCDNTYKEYNITIPSASGATACNVWLAYDLVKKRWFEKEPGASEIPQAAWPVYDTDGKQYIYAGIDDGNVMRLENGATWADDSATAMSPVIETGDFFPSGNFWDITSIRRVKTVVKKISESSKNLAVTWYKDTEASGTSLTAHDLDAGDPISKSTQGAPSATPLRGWCHRLNFALSAGFASETQFRPVGWGYQYQIDHEDERDV